MRSERRLLASRRAPAVTVKAARRRTVFLYLSDALCIVEAARLSSRFAGSPAAGVSAFMARDVVDSEVVELRDALVAWFEAGCKPAGPSGSARNTKRSLSIAPIILLFPMAASGASGRCSKACAPHLGWERIEDRENLIGLYDAKGEGAISLEPGGQFELSGAPLDDAHATAAELDRHLAACRIVAEPLGIGFLTLGMSPKWSLAETPVMPKSRYAIMARYMPKVGTRGLDMMFRTATVQANLDFASEQDMVTKMRVGLALQPAIDRPVRQFAVHRRQAQRPSVRSLGNLAPYRSGAHRHARLRLRARHGLRALCRLRARRAALFREARRPLSGRGGRQAFATCSPAGSGKRRASAPRSPIGRTTCRRSSPRCGSSASSKCAAPTSGRRIASSRSRR